MKEFFLNLKEIREKKGLTLEEISERTRLSIQYLRDIEKGQLENLPAGYDRIFFKRYLKEIGEDKDEVWRDFNLFFGTGPLEKNMPYSSDIPESKKESPIEEPEEKKTEVPEKVSAFQNLMMQLNMDKIYKYFWGIITIAVLGIVGYFAYQQYIFVKNTPPEVKEISVSQYISEMQTQDSLLTPRMSEDTEISSAGEVEFDVRLHARERTWIREIRDQKDTTDYIMSEGLNRKISASQSVKLMLGRADGVELWINKDSLGVMGAPDEVVVSLVLTQKGITEKRLKKITPTRETPPDTSASISAAAGNMSENARDAE
ncbi:MAG: helix-turn-helix domain-containing protein [Calditrichaeota bacterium]|nr:helix-turn-helix domain-containing protein [Calditrichota bacterium]RQV92611.1 MAG: helix-turn-helix domain-containing protein [bacterium]RQV99843.1 MAG: helix-turn-helix domain-containing protein [Calditrichota bacterium]